MDKAELKKLIMAGMAAKGTPVDETMIDNYMDVIIELKEKLPPQAE